MKRQFYTKREDGTASPYRNIEYLPAFFFIPKELLDRCPSDLRNLSRVPWEYFTNRKLIQLVESDLFLELIIDAYAYMAWRYLDISPFMEIYSGDDPIWRLAHNPHYWIDTLEKFGILPTLEEMIPNEGLMLYPRPYATLEQVSAILERAIPLAVRRFNLQPIIDAVREYRCFEDFDYRKSRQKTDFRRKWFHTRTKNPLMSLESFQEDHLKSREDTPDWRNPILEREGDIHVQQFLEQLSPRDRDILELRMDDYTLKEIAEELGYANHSGVHKRLCKIREEYIKFAGQLP